MKKLVYTSCLFVLLGCSCLAKITPKPVQLHPVLQENLMVIPKGTSIGGYKAPENGVFMSETVFYGLILEILDSCNDRQDEYRF